MHIDEWLIHKLTPQETYNLLEIIESHVNNSRVFMIFSTQYNNNLRDLHLYPLLIESNNMLTIFLPISIVLYRRLIELFLSQPLP